jgi:hypothetical protein
MITLSQPWILSNFRKPRKLFRQHSVLWRYYSDRINHWTPVNLPLQQLSIPLPRLICPSATGWIGTPRQARNWNLHPRSLYPTSRIVSGLSPIRPSPSASFTCLQNSDTVGSRVSLWLCTHDRHSNLTNLVTMNTLGLSYPLTVRCRPSHNCTIYLVNYCHVMGCLGSGHRKNCLPTWVSQI